MLATICSISKSCVTSFHIFNAKPKDAKIGRNCIEIKKNKIFRLKLKRSESKDESLLLIKLIEKGKSENVKIVAKIGGAKNLKVIILGSTAAVCITIHQPTPNCLK